jgi:hypothetical protein
MPLLHRALRPLCRVHVHSLLMVRVLICFDHLMRKDTHVTVNTRCRHEVEVYRQIETIAIIMCCPIYSK